jgi:Tol biopolymer transport system component
METIVLLEKFRNNPDHKPLTMKKMLTTALLATCLVTAAQDDDCLERRLTKEGSWRKLKETVKATGADLAMQRKFYTAALNQMQAAYTPKAVVGEVSASFMPVVYNQPVSTWRCPVFVLLYLCQGGQVVLQNPMDVSTMLTYSFNTVDFLEIYDTPGATHETGFFPLRAGIPTEVAPGIWQFTEAINSSATRGETAEKRWLITYDGQLPWSWVTRKEFLLRRKQTVQRLQAEARRQTQEAIDHWETFKKQKEKEYANDEAKMANFMTGYYNPGLKEARAKQPRILAQFDASLKRIEDQLAAPAADLDKRAIVIKSSANYLDYDFVDTMQPFAELLTKPAPGYFKKGSSPSVPQMMTVSIVYRPDDAVSARFAADVEKAIRFDYLKSFIGKTAPPLFTGERTAQSAPTQPVADGAPKAPSATSSTKAATEMAGTKPAAASPTKQTAPGTNIFLTGELGAPAGIPVTIGHTNGTDLTLTLPKAANKLFSASPVKFSKPVAENETFAVSLKKIPSNMKGVVYSGSGKAPEDAGKIRIGVDYTYELLTRSSDDAAFSTFYESFAPAVGGYRGEEGRYVVFVSNTKGFAGSDGRFRQVFWRDRNTGITKMISIAPSGEQGNGDCGEPSISADGKSVVFESKATNLVGGDNNNFKDIFLWRAATNSIELVSRSVTGGSADAESFDAALSGDGNYVVFTSAATNLSATPKGRSVANVFWRDIAGARTEMLSVDPAQKAGGNGYKGSISFDGSRVSFCSPSNTLAAGDNNGLWDIFLWQRGKSMLKRISLTHDGKERNGGAESASRQVASAISGNGRFVAFATTATNMIPGDNNTFQDVFVVEVETGKVQVASFTNEGEPSNGDSPIEQGERIAISFDGRWVAFPTKATNLGAQSSNIILYNTQTGKNLPATNTRGSYVGRPAISFSGGYVVFGKSEALDLRMGTAFGGNGGGIFAHFTGNGPCRDCRE